MKPFEAYGYVFPTFATMRKYRDLVELLEQANVDMAARARLCQRLIEKYDGRVMEREAA